MDTDNTPLFAVFIFPEAGRIQGELLKAFSDNIGPEGYTLHAIEITAPWKSLPYRGGIVVLSTEAVDSGEASALIDKLRVDSPNMKLLLLEADEHEWIGYTSNVLDQINVRDPRTAERLRNSTAALLKHILSFKLPPTEAAIEAKTMLLGPGGRPHFNPVLFTPLEQFEFTNRSRRVLFSRGILRVGDLVRLSEAQLLNLPNLGKKSLMEIKDAVDWCGLRLGSDVPNWPPDDFEAEEKLGELAKRIGNLRQMHVGARFEPAGDSLVIDPAGDSSDEMVAAKAFTAQMHAEVIRKARIFSEVAPRLANQPGWLGIGAAAVRFLEAVDRSTGELPAVLGSMYGPLTELGSFLELGSKLDTDDTSFAPQMDAAIKRPLDDLVRTAAPWLRSFPSIAEIDNELAHFMAPGLLLNPSSKIVTAANEVELIIKGDAEALRGILEAGLRGDVQGNKAGNRGVASARNLVTVAVTILTAAYAGALSNEAGPKSIIVEKSAQFIVGAEADIVKVMQNLSADFRAALRSLTQDLQSGPPPHKKPK